MTRPAGGLSGLAVDEAAEMSIDSRDQLSDFLLPRQQGRVRRRAIRRWRVFKPPDAPPRVVTDLLFAHQLGITL